MDIGSELAPAVAVAQKVPYDREDDTEGLKGDMPAGADDLPQSVERTE